MAPMCKTGLSNSSNCSKGNVSKLKDIMGTGGITTMDGIAVHLDSSTAVSDSIAVAQVNE